LSAVHAAAPHNTAMNIRLFLGGLRPPTPSRGWGNGETRFPHPPARGLRPHLPGGGGMGKPGFPTPLAEGVCSPQAPCAGRTPPDANGPGARAGRPRRGAAGTVTVPALTLLRWGREPGASPQRGEAGRGAERGERWSPQPPMRLRRTTPQCTYGCSWEGAALPDPPAGGGMGKPGFPILLRAGCARTFPGAGAWGNPVSPPPSPRAYVHLRRAPVPRPRECARRGGHRCARRRWRAAAPRPGRRGRPPGPRRGPW